MMYALWLVPAAAGAGTPGWTEIDPEALVALCWAVSQEDRDSGVTARMVQGTGDTIDCLEEEIVRHATEFLTTKNEDEIREAVSAIKKSFAEFYWAMYNENKGCDPSCGSIHHVSHVSALAALLEDILRDLFAQRNFYER
jgi:hypothetical protein